MKSRHFGAALEKNKQFRRFLTGTEGFFEEVNSLCGILTSQGAGRILYWVNMLKFFTK